ncbi:hypothetical protein DM01DRAFT_1403091 [Hesseltinella vesiculosa]|uniref:Nuclear pore complex protein NUP96 C-terminal domain-containing protein n=1 Tax=Hesseltinella vesiculosa TaxID=101127 RepID=A0A1X2GX02_9FUNG|nr:hypothetical protein DM01DRAFT_1403091 [Hesseltinella vesiculosa]
MSLLNILTSWKGKRLNEDAFPDHDRYMKKQRPDPSPKSAVPNDDTETKESRCKLNRLIMSNIQNQSSVDLSNGVPRAQLTKNIFASGFIDYIMDNLREHGQNELQLWSLGAFLFSEPNIERKTHSISCHQQRRLKNWIRATVLEEMAAMPSAFNFALNTPPFRTGDRKADWERCFYFLSTGQVVQAAELAQQLGDDALMAMLVVHYQQDDTPLDIHEAAEQQIQYWQQEGVFDNFELDRKRMWYVLQGRLGYVDDLKMVVTEDLLWPQTILLYALYGDRYGHLPSALARYELLLSTSQQTANLHRLRTLKRTEKIPPTCLWYRLLLWWSITMAPDAFLSSTGARPDLEFAFPLRFRWLLLLHVPNMLTHPNKDTWFADWCNQLFQDGMDYMAIHAALYMPNPTFWIKDTLPNRLWDKEHYLIRQLHIPSPWILEAKAVHAHRRQAYDEEIGYYQELGNSQLHCHAILHRLAQFFTEGYEAGKVQTYLEMLSIHFLNDQHVQSIVASISRYQSLLASNNLDQDARLLELKTSLHDLSSACHSIDPSSLAVIATGIFQQASTMLDQTYFGQLLDTFSAEWKDNKTMAQVLTPYVAYATTIDNKKGFSTNPLDASMITLKTYGRLAFKITGYTLVSVTAATALIWQSYHWYIEYQSRSPASLNYKAKQLLHGAYFREEIARDYGMAAVYMEQVLRVALEEQKLEEDSMDIIGLRLRLAMDEWRAGNLFDAITQYTLAWKSLMEQATNEGSDQPLVSGLQLTTAKYLGDLYLRIGDKDKAEEFLAWALHAVTSMEEKAGTSNDDRILSVGVFCSLASLYARQRQFQLALPLFLEALKRIPDDVVEESKQKDDNTSTHPWLCQKAILQNQLAETLYGMGKKEEALGWAQASLASASDGLATYATDTQDCRECGAVAANNLGRLLELKKEFKEALDYYKQAQLYASTVYDSASQEKYDVNVSRLEQLVHSDRTATTADLVLQNTAPAQPEPSTKSSWASWFSKKM